LRSYSEEGQKDLNQPLAFGPWLALAGVANMLLFQGI
jgi:general secretion pathway protein O